MLAHALIVFAAGGVGAALRYLASVGVRALLHGGHDAPRDDAVLALLPLATLGVNALGCLAIGFVHPLLHGQRDELRLAIVVGLLGGFTTFSAFGHETVTLIAQDRHLWAGAYVLLSLALGIAGVFAGHALGSRLA